MKWATWFFRGYKSFEVPTRRLWECSLEHEWMMALRQIWCGGVYHWWIWNHYFTWTSVTWKDSLIALELQIKRVKSSHPKSDLWQEELDVDVELLNWEDCAQNLVSRVGMLKFRCKLRRRCEVWLLVQIDGLQDKVQENLKTLRIVLYQKIYVWCFFSEHFLFVFPYPVDSPNRKVFFCWSFVVQVDKTWRQVSSQKYRSILDLLGKKAIDDSWAPDFWWKKWPCRTEAFWDAKLIIHATELSGGNLGCLLYHDKDSH